MSHSHSNLAARQHRAQLWRLWGWPLAMGLLSLVGLLTGLVFDGWGDVLSWIALAIPVLVMLWFGWLRRPGPEHRQR
ncbi:hypothetical protein GT347_14285 [Xylophilus rhododendri]|uniref:DUF4175 domain-containing protein n=1 Tax=Xylophilus rhododendri TaxID=2697032 RepID=A0A857J7J3_9BURK|nr:hypothetical protein [Xylophilus rhododendri]QHI99049.1 hypothetical protein GT347_14285 [Xylophilus rhododendri]